jgi:antitoxin MazE
MQVSRWGNSLAVRLPAKLMRELELKEGDDLEVEAVGGKTLQLRKKMTREEAVEALGKFNLRAPAGYTFQRKDAYPDGKY